jgi:FtsZ-binding cell division protein ZapB
MTATGLDKFAHLEDKIYRAVEYCKVLQQEKERLEQENEGLRGELNALTSDKDRSETNVQKLLAERDKLRMKVEAMLDTIAVLEMEAEVRK